MTGHMRSFCPVCGAQDYLGLGLCSWHLTEWEHSFERRIALSRPGAVRDDKILDEALDSFIERARIERTWIQ